MSKDENIEVIKKTDLELLEKIASKYCVSLQELGRIISRKKATYPRLQILLNSDELSKIDKKAKEKKLSRSKYCSMCYKMALKKKCYENIDVIKAIGRNQDEKNKREYRAVISFDNADDYIEMKKLSKKLGIPCSSLMRYFALNINL